MDQRQGLPVSSDLLFITIAQQWLSKDDGGDAGFIDFYALDPVGRYCALNEGVFPKRLEALRGLSGKQFLLASRLPRSARYQEVDAGRDSNFREKSRKVIITFPFHKAADPPAP